eukprot:2770222-Alexandrium_andersonii.AAC.1
MGGGAPTVANRPPRPIASTWGNRRRSGLPRGGAQHLRQPKWGDARARTAPNRNLLRRPSRLGT